LLVPVDGRCSRSDGAFVAVAGGDCGGDAAALRAFLGVTMQPHDQRAVVGVAE
jgi:hypothetical protein